MTLFNKNMSNNNVNNQYFGVPTRWWSVLASLLVMVCLQIVDSQSFRFQHDWVEQSEFWRVITGHWIHFNWQHLLLNGLGLVLCVGITRPIWSIGRWIVYNLLLAVGISMLLTWLNPELDWYVGYSGVLFGVFLLAAIELFKTERIMALLLGLGVCSKVVFEQMNPMTVITSDIIGVPVIIDAHLYGILLAFVIALAFALVNQVYTIVKKYSQTIAPNKQN
ncbi:MAG: rhomboid family GlyGly-CTERM serine protease [Candidatus Azotimanducaceae bacterium]|jgi:rhomboid family GlyGly-CTERM serine protease